MEQIKEKKRIEWVDMLKGLAIICVIIGHRTGSSYAILPCALRIWIYSFHMPLFFLLSGFVFSIDKYENFKQFFINKIKTIIIPMVFFSIVIWLFNYLYYGVLLNHTYSHFLENIKRMIISLFMQERHGEYNSTLWFLTCLFVVQIMFYGTLKVSKNLWNILGIIFVCFVIGVIYVEVGGELLPWEIDTAFISIVFVGLGYILKKQVHVLDRIPIYVGIIFLLINFVLTYINFKMAHEQVDLAINILGNPILFLISALSAIMGFVVLFSKLKRINFLSYIGRNSLIYYGLSDMMLFLPEILMYNILHLNIQTMGNASILIGFGCAFIVCLVIWPISLVINKKMRFVLGKF